MREGGFYGKQEYTPSPWVWAPSQDFRRYGICVRPRALRTVGQRQESRWRWVHPSLERLRAYGLLQYLRCDLTCEKRWECHRSASRQRFLQCRERWPLQQASDRFRSWDTMAEDACALHRWIFGGYIYRCCMEIWSQPHHFPFHVWRGGLWCAPWAVWMEFTWFRWP